MELLIERLAKATAEYDAFHDKYRRLRYMVNGKECCPLEVLMIFEGHAPHWAAATEALGITEWTRNHIMHLADRHGNVLRELLEESE